MTALKTLLVSQWFPPEPVNVPLSIAKELQNRGHSVEVLTGIPNYPTGTVSDGYHCWKPQSGSEFGFRVRRTPLYPSHDASALRRMLNYVSWAASSTLLGGKSLGRADVALVYSSPATAAAAPLLWRRLTHTPFVVLIQDLWPDSVTSSGLAGSGLVTKLIERLLTRFVSWTYRRAAHIVVISPGMLDVLAARGVPPAKISLVYNWAADEAQASRTDRHSARRRLGIDDDAFVVAYAGNQGAAQGLHTVITSAGHVEQTHPHVVFVLAGDGVEASNLITASTSAGRTNIRFPGRLDPTGMQDLRAASDVQLVSLIDDDLFAVTMPSKIQSILASAQPLIVMAPGDAADVARASGAGWAVAPGDAAALTEAVSVACRLTANELNTMGAAGACYYASTMSSAIGSSRLDEILRNAASDRRQTQTNGATQ